MSLWRNDQPLDRWQQQQVRDNTYRSSFSSSVSLRISTPWISTPRAGVMNDHLPLPAFLRTRFSRLPLVPSEREGACNPRSMTSRGSIGGQSTSGKEGLRWLKAYEGSSDEGRRTVRP